MHFAKPTTAMILAAGRGERMGELTAHRPKPLLPLGESTLIALLLRKLAAAGIQRVVINLHYRGEQIKQSLGDGDRFGLEIVYSVEPELLNTGGGIARAAGFFLSYPLLVLNSDVLCEIDIRDFAGFHRKTGCLASLAAKKSSNFEEYALISWHNGRLKDFLRRGSSPPRGKFSTGIYTGYQLLEREAVELLQPRPESVIDGLYRKLLQKEQPVAIYPVRGEWLDLGTREKYAAAREQIAAGKIELTRFL